MEQMMAQKLLKMNVFSFNYNHAAAGDIGSAHLHLHLTFGYYDEKYREDTDVDWNPIVAV